MPIKFKILIGVSYAVTAAGGFSLAMGVMHQRLQAQYDERLETELTAAKKVYAKRYKADEFSDLGKLAAEVIKDELVVEEAPVDETKRQAEYLEQAVKILAEQQYTPYNAKPEAEPQRPEERVEVLASMTKTNSVWDNNVGIVETEEYDEAREHAKADQGKPYVVQDSVYYDNEEGKPQFTFQYFEGDDVLVDEKDRPVDKIVIERNLGTENLRFGYGSANKNTVLIHNPVSDNMYEIVRTTENYYGNFDEDEDRGSTLRKFRDGD